MLNRGATVGIELAVAVIGCMLAGRWLDARFDTDPWLTLAGVALGSVVGLKALLRASKE